MLTCANHVRYAALLGSALLGLQRRMVVVVLFTLKRRCCCCCCGGGGVRCFWAQPGKNASYLLVCFWQFPPHLRAGVKHTPSSEYAQYPNPPCFEQVFHMLTILLVQPPITHSPGPPPCLPQRPLRSEVVVQPATEHDFFLPPPCLKQ